MEKEENVYVEQNGEGKVAEAIEGTQESGCPTNVPAAPKKFKDVDALVRAYGALEAEFTRRSQRLKELEKQVENLKIGAGVEGSSVEKLRKNAQARRVATQAFDAFIEDLNSAEKHSVEQPTLPAQERPTAVLKTEKNEETLDKGDQVGVPMRVDGERAKDGEQSPVASVAKGNAISSEELYTRAHGDEEVRLRIIKEYLSSLGKSAPPLTAGGVGTLATPPLKARNIADAGNLALQYFKKPFESL